MTQRRRWLGIGVVVVVLFLLAVPSQTLTIAASGRCGDPHVRPWCASGLSPDQRAGLLFAALTENEKISLLAGVGNSGHTGQTRAIERVGLPSMFITDDGVGIKQGSATALPIPIALAATFDPGMATLHGGVIGNEAKAKGNDVVLGPTVNIMRTPLGGRTFEAYGEDPYLDSRTAVSWIESAQAQGVIAEVKHYCCNNQEGPPGSGLKMYSSSNLDERTLREIYLPQFEAAVKEAHAGTVMCAYNRVNEDWSCENHHLLSDILKGEWGFQGMVVSDWQATHETVLALRNGLDLEMPTAMDYRPTLVTAALTTGLVTTAEVDDHVRRLLRTMFAFDLFDRPPYTNDDRQIAVAAHARVAQKIEESGITLLKNDRILPLDPHGLRSIALIGPQADRFENGGNADDVKAFTYTTPRQEITRRAGPTVTVKYDDGSNAKQAAAVARTADVAIVFASDSEGENLEKTCPSVDCSARTPTSKQDSLISSIAAANPNTIVVLETGDPVLTPWRGQIRGLLEAWYPGEMGGTAIARVLFGDVDPGGRLPVTFPNSAADIPTAGDPTQSNGPEVNYTEGVMVGYRWYDSHNLTPAFPFGAGLSYTTFRFGNLAIHPGGAGAGDVATVSVTITNTGTRAGVAVPQLYLGLPSPSSTVPQPPRQLKGYDKLSLAPGQSRTATFTLDDRAFSYWDVASGAWRVAPGCYGVFVGSSSRDLPLTGSIARSAGDCGAGAVSAAAAASALPNTSTATRSVLPVGVAVVLLAALLALKRQRRAHMS